MSQLQTLLHSAANHCRNLDCEKAIDALDRAVRLHPQSAEPHRRLGVCYSGCCRTHSLVSAGLAVAHLKHAIKLLDGSGASFALAQAIEALANTYMANCPADPSSEGRAAIEYGRKAAEMYRKQGLPFEAARVEHNLGNTWCELPEAEFLDKWRNAVSHFERALKVRTKPSHPGLYAATMMNLGTAYRELSNGDRTGSVRQAICCHARAHHVYRPAAYPLQNANLHNNLGNAFLSLAAVDITNVSKNVRRAVRHFELALRVRNRHERPCDYAVTQLNRGQAFLRWTMLEPLRFLDEAATCFKEASECFRLCGQNGNAGVADAHWARTQSLPFI
jgi:tetratricopeptide (TPR) repeat protein